jgi:hypothetical protein
MGDNLTEGGEEIARREKEREMLEINVKRAGTFD